MVIDPRAYRCGSTKVVYVSGEKTSRDLHPIDLKIVSDMNAVCRLRRVDEGSCCLDNPFSEYTPSAIYLG